MKPVHLIIICACFLASCTQGNSTGQAGNKAGEKAKEEVISYVEGYLKDRLKDARLFIDEEDGLITITNDAAGYKINQPKIVIGKIDEDDYVDAVVPIYTLRGQSVMGYDHLVVLNTSGTFSVKTVIRLC